MLAEISGEFVRIVFTDDIQVQLEQGSRDRPAARFNRVGEDALYLSPDAESAKVAIGGTVQAGDPDRVLLRFEVGPCRLFDLRHSSTAQVYEQARQRWRPALAEGREPESWRESDKLRAAGHVGLIDPSRRRPGLWHITLFRWNVSGAPTVRRIGDPEPILVEPDYR